MRTLMLPGVAVFLLVSGCAQRQAEPPERIAFSCWSGAPCRPGPMPVGLAPSRLPAADEQALMDEALIGGLDWGMWGPFPEDATIPVKVVAMGGGFIFYVPGFVVGAVASVLTFPILGIGTFLWLPTTCGGATGTAGYYILGVPFYAVQKVVWDGPRAFGRFVNLAVRSPKSKMNYLVTRVDDSPRGREVYQKLKKLTGEDFGSGEKWTGWWQAHRDEFDKNMKPIRPAAPEPKPGAPAAPKPAPAPAS